MKYKILVLLINFMSGHVAFSQKTSEEIARNSIYLEAGGIGGFGSLNYERMVFIKNHFTFAARFGLSTYNIKDYTNKFNPDLVFPIVLNACYGKNHKIECGIGETFTALVQADLEALKPKRTTNFHLNFNIGYRYQKNTGGIILRCGYTPIITYHQYYRHWLGVSIGYAFKKNMR